MTVEEQIREMGVKARAAATVLRAFTTAQKNAALTAIADALDAAKPQIDAANAEDVAAAQTNGLAPALVDRHGRNYFVHVDVKTHKVTVKGIDNDTGYSQYRTGAVKFTFDKNRTQTFKAKLKNLAKEIDSRHIEKEQGHHLRDQGRDGREDRCRAGQDRQRDLQRPHGTEGGAEAQRLPRLHPPAPFGGQLQRGRQSPRRRDRPSRTAQERRQGHRGAGWQDVQEEPVQTGKVPIQKRDGKVKNVGGDIENYVHVLTCPSYFARDQFPKFFG